MSAGKLITIEGLDGSGKSTLAAALAERLRSGGARVELLREPGGVAASERIRELVQDPALHVGARAEALLYAAARAQLVQERLLPLLQEGALVLLDRFLDSSLAYQGAGRDLGVAEVRELNLFATRGLVPDRTLLLRIDPSEGLRRAARRPGEPDRLELQEGSFFDAVARAYDELAAAEPGRFRVLDAALPPEAVLAAALHALADLGRPGAADA